MSDREKRIENEVSRTRIISRRESNRDRDQFSKENVSRFSNIKTAVVSTNLLLF